MVTRILSAVVLAPLFFVVLFFLPPVFLAVLLACITARASFELLRATKVAHHNGMYVYTAAAAGLIPLTFWLGWGNWSLAALSLLLIAVLLACITARASFELLRATKVAHHNGLYVYTAAAAGLIPLTFWLGWGNWSLAALSLLLMAALFLGAIRRFDSGSAISLEDLLVCMFGGIVIPAFLSTLVLLKGMESGRYLVLLPVISAFLTDAGAYFVGVFFGKHKGITRVSPNKSLEGYAGGILFGGLFMLSSRMRAPTSWGCSLGSTKASLGSAPTNHWRAMPAASCSGGCSCCSTEPFCISSAG